MTSHRKILKVLAGMVVIPAGPGGSGLASMAWDDARLYTADKTVEDWMTERATTRQAG